jgi:hypothetical protein
MNQGGSASSMRSVRTIDEVPCGGIHPTLHRLKRRVDFPSAIDFRCIQAMSNVCKTGARDHDARPPGMRLSNVLQTRWVCSICQKCLDDFQPIRQLVVGQSELQC